MKKLLISTILGLTITGGADASIVSRGFFEEQIGNYATLDLLNSKANQKDLTALSDRIGVRNWSVDNSNLLIDSFPFTKELFPNLYGSGDSWVLEDVMPMSYYFELNNANPGWPGLAGVTDKILHGWTNSNRLTRQGLIALNDGWTDKNDGTTYLGLKDLNTKIGNLPDGIPPALAVNAEQLNERLSVKLDIKYPQSLEDLILDLYGTKDYKPGILQLALDAMSLVLEHEDIFSGVESQNRRGILERIDNVETQIGTLPAGYDSVGAALEAINAKVDNKITNLSATASNGKYVLTAVKEGDQTTYAWESIDRSESETTTTE